MKDIIKFYSTYSAFNTIAKYYNDDDNTIDKKDNEVLDTYEYAIYCDMLKDDDSGILYNEKYFFNEI